MSCLYPSLAFLDERSSPRKVYFKPKPEWLIQLPEGFRCVQIPCGKCFACVKTRALDITVRAIAESRIHDFTSFITLTVNEDRLSEVFPNGLVHRPWQLFAKRLRKKIGKFSFLMCGEYGSVGLRPHYHAIIFGHKFIDSYCRDDGTFCPSRVLQDCWPDGFVNVSEAVNERIAYVAGYTVKDFALDRDHDFYRSRNLGLPYVRWSRRPALGLRWFNRYYRDLVSDTGMKFVLHGKEFNFSSRYFLNRLELTDPVEHATLLDIRRLYSLVQDDNTCIMRHQALKRKCELSLYNAKRKAQEAKL